MGTSTSFPNPQKTQDHWQCQVVGCLVKCQQVYPGCIQDLSVPMWLEHAPSVKSWGISVLYHLSSLFLPHESLGVQQHLASCFVSTRLCPVLCKFPSSWHNQELPVSKPGLLLCGDFHVDHNYSFAENEFQMSSRQKFNVSVGHHKW